MRAAKLIRNVALGLLGLVFVVLVALQIILRPKVLTGIVNRVAAAYVEGDVNFSRVKAHVIKSFPFLSVEARDFSITYPHERYARYDTLYPQQNRRFNLMQAGVSGTVDTLLSVRSLHASVNYVALLRGEYHIRRLEMERPRIFAHYFDSTAANWDILPIGSSREEKDSTGLPPIKVGIIGLRDKPLIVFTDPADTLHALFTLRRLELEKTLRIDSMFVSGRLPKDTLALAVDYLEARAELPHIELDARAKAFLRTGSFGRLQVPIGITLDADIPKAGDGELEALIRSLRLQLSKIELEGSGSLSKHPGGNWDMNLSAAIRDCPLGDVIREYRNNIPALGKLSTDARISLDAHAEGTYGPGQSPSVNARLLVPPATIDYEGLGRSGKLALDVNVVTDNLKEVNAQVDKLLLDIAGARINVTGSARDVLGEDPLLSVNGSVHARVDSLTQAFTRENGIVGTGSLSASLNGKARLSQLDMVHIGNADIHCDIDGKELCIEMPADSIRALLPALQMNLATRGNKIDKNIRQGARVLALKAHLDTLDVSIRDMFVRGGDVTLLLQNSADILKGGKKLTPLMGLLKAGNLGVKDAEGMSVRLADNTETFRVTPASASLPHARLSLSSKSGRVRVRSGENIVGLRQLHFDVSASKHAARKRPPRDSTRRRGLRRGLPQDDFASSDIRFNLSESLRKYVREWDIRGNLEMDAGRIFTPSFPLRTRLSKVSGTFDNDTLNLRGITLESGASDISASAQLTGLRRALGGRRHSLLKLKADVRSKFIDANELMRGYAYYSTYQPDKSLSSARSDSAIEDAVQRASLPDSAGSRLLVIPSNLQVDFSLESTGIKYDSLLVSWAAADVAMRNRTLQVTNAVAASNMGDIYFEGFYATRSKDDIKAGFDLNLVDITAEKVITLFPAVDSIMPMLRSFAGDLDCELAATTSIDTLMNVVIPSIDGVLRISGSELSLKDSEEFARIARLLMFRDRKNMFVDNMAVTGMLRDNTLEVFPFVLDVDRYQLAASGIHELDRQFNYHISVIKSPLLIKFGLNAWGPDFDHIHYGLGKAKYRSANVPVFTKQLDTVQYSLVSAIHNIFELGLEKALQENRTGDYLGAASASLQEGAAPPGGEEGTREHLEGILPVVENVSEQASGRREALKQEILELEKKHSGHRPSP